MKAIVIAGRLGRDSELRRTQSGDPVLSFTVAVDDGYGQNKKALWFDCSVWGKRAESLESMLKKGKEVTVAGDFSTREHDGKTYLTVRVNDVKLQGGNAGSSSGRTSDFGSDNGGSNPSPAASRNSYGDIDDGEIPF